jgi:hypothetical protein
MKGFKYLIIPDLNLIIESWIGNFNFDEILEQKKMESADPKWKDNYNVLADDRQTNFEINVLLNDNSKYLSLSQNFIKKRKTALLTSLPHQVVTSILLQMHKHPEALVELEVFSTVKAAINWLNIDIKELNRIDMLFNQMSDEIKKQNEI